ncbi:hypothetical protein Tco_0638190 [Tanacetum coccineum]
MSHRCQSPVIDAPLPSPLSVVVTESSVRSDLHFNDEDGATCLTTVEIFENLAFDGYERDSDKLSFEKALFSPHWKYLIHTILHCLSSKSSTWNEFLTNVASTIICLAKGQKFNFSKLIFDAMTAKAKEIASKEESQELGFDVVRMKYNTVKGDRRASSNCAAEVVNAGVSVSIYKPKTPSTTTTTTLLEDDEVTVAATLVQMSDRSKAKLIVFEGMEESAKEQR